MKFLSEKKIFYGTSIPVSALKTETSCGVGEFLDLIPFANFCKKTSINLIQLLPVNDTGADNSPYSALSAFALHPLYIRLQAIPEAKKFQKEIIELQTTTTVNSDERFDTQEIRHKKISLLHEIFNAHEEAILTDATEGNLFQWINKNPWVIEYAIFKNLKRHNFDASWKTWTHMRTPTKEEIRKTWKDKNLRREHIFYAWVQMHLHDQFITAAHYCNDHGILLKGDIPILMNEDSVDVWIHSEFFRMDLRAGSPPDNENPTGQVWGFPIYNWNNLQENDYSWWKNRLKHAEQFYHSFRIDHIIGFFRIWAIPEGEQTALLGWEHPYEEITQDDLAALGYSKERIKWVSEPHIPTSIVQEVNNNDYLHTHDLLNRLMNRIENEELFLFKNSIKNENDIRKYKLPAEVEAVLRKKWQDRMLVIIGRNSKGQKVYRPTRLYANTTAWNSLSEKEKYDFNTLVAKKNDAQEKLWKIQAEKILSELCSSVEMFACAEDLGSIPKTLPEVLKKLNIYSLKVFRWERRWEEEGCPFIPIKNYPPLSVATSSVHDSSTLRGWWENEISVEEGRSLLKALEIDSEAETDLINNSDNTLIPYTEKHARILLSAMARVPSKITVFPIQDLLALSADHYASSTADSERINIPATVLPFNWTYRIPLSIESLLKNTPLLNAIKEVSNVRPKK